MSGQTSRGVRSLPGPGLRWVTSSGPRVRSPIRRGRSRAVPAVPVDRLRGVVLAGLAPAADSLGALRLHRALAGGEVEVLDVHAEQLVGAGDGLVEHPVCDPLAQGDIAPRDQAVDGRLGTDRGVRAGVGHPLAPGRDVRRLQAAVVAPGEPAADRATAGVPGAGGGGAPELLEGLADLVVGDGRQGRPSPSSGTTLPSAVVYARRVLATVRESR